MTTEIPEYTDVIPNPFDVNYSFLSNAAITTTAAGATTTTTTTTNTTLTGFFPSGEIQHDFASIDCHSNVVFCDPTNNLESPQCHKCNTIGGGICLDASHLSDKLLPSDIKSSNIKKKNIGVCVPKSAGIQEDLEDTINHFTTDIVLGIVGDYTHINEDNNQPIEQMYITRKTICKDDRIVRKNSQMIKTNPLAEGFMNCDEIVMCGGEDMGYPIHPYTKKIINHIDDIDFDIIQEANLLSCGCADGYEMVQDPVSNLSTCKKGERRGKKGLSCPVTLRDYDTGTIRCVCNPATQVNLYEIVESIEKGGLSTDYSTDMVLALTAFQNELLEGADACIPKPGVDPRVSAFGYSFAAHVFYDSYEDVNQFRLENNKGGHLMTGGLVRRSGVTSGGKWVSVIENYNDDDNNNNKKEASYSIGGISPFLGTGSVPAHIWGGDVFNNNNIIVSNHTDKNKTTVIHPNASLKMVPPSTTGIPGIGVTLEHAVGMIVSAGRYYPQGVYRRGGQLANKGCGINKESCFLSEVQNMDKDNPLTQMMSTNDPGTCAAAFIVPFFHDKCQTGYEKYPFNARIPKEANTQRLGGWTGHYHVRPIALAMGYTPLERLFRFYCSTQKFNLEFPNKVPSMFPHMIPTKNFSSLDIMQWQHLFDSKKFGTVDLLGGLFIQPTTVKGPESSSLNTKWAEEMISTNLPCLIDHYEIDDGRALSRNEQQSKKKNNNVYTRYPTASNIVANQTSIYSGYSLPGRNGLTINQSDSSSLSSLSFLQSVIFGAENMIWNDPGFTPLALPQDIPVATLPEEIRYSRRNDCFGLSKSSLADFKNKYANFENEPFELSLAKNENVYNPPVLRSEVVNGFPTKYINNWIPGRADGIVPSLNLAEAFFKMRPFCSRYFFTNKPNMLKRDWGSNPHTSGDLFQGMASAPCSKYEMGGYLTYPSSGSLTQYITLLSPRSFDTGPYGAAHTNNTTSSTTTTADNNTPQNLLNKLKKATNEDSALLIMEASRENCDCLTDIICTSNKQSEEEEEKRIAATPSRGNRFASYLFCRSTPKHYLPLMYSLLRLQNKDPKITLAISEKKTTTNFNVLQNIKSIDWDLPVAPNRFAAVRTNAPFTRFFAREPIIPYSSIVSLSSLPSTITTNKSGGNNNNSSSSSTHSPLPIDYHDDAIIERDDWQYNVRIGKPAYLLATDEQGQLIHKRLIDFYESSCRISPNMICSDTFSAWHEGPRGIVSMYGTPIMGDLNPKEEDDNNNKKKKKTMIRPSPMRMIHSYAINTPYMGGFECGQTPAEGMLTRGLEMWYHPFLKPPLSAGNTDHNVTTTLEGIRAKSQEPFERLAVRGFREIDWLDLIKYSLLSHYGIDGLVSFAYTDRNATNNTTPIRMTNGSARYPFACQSDRVPFPLTMQMTIQMRALLDMGVNKELVFKHVNLEEQNQIISN
uniref:Wsv209-like protein n=1 Tax=Metapenaeus joyneri majanivirus TaxID=2984280 RepID=A0A9C7BMP8_9VIRU|nr:MAG: wsv209-like protein [Metapenaeus joyneri majanivirus]